MPVKIKINWDNKNPVSESVRIYRAASAFTSNNLPLLLTEILGDIYEYEDLTTVENQTYFYMLSAKLGDEEVFTECFEIIASKAAIPTIVSIDSEQILNSRALSATFYSKNGDYIYLHDTSITNGVGFKKHATINPFGDYQTSAISTISLPSSLFGNSTYISFFSNGLGLCVIAGTSSYKRYIYELTESFDISTARFKSVNDLLGFERCKIVENHYITAGNGVINVAQISGDIFSSYTVGPAITYAVPTNFTYCFDVSRDGKKMVLVSGNRTTSQEKRIVSLKSNAAFDFSVFEQSIVNRGASLGVTRGNNTDRFIYDDFMLLYNIESNNLLKAFFTKL